MKSKLDTKSVILTIIRLLLAIVFIFSGFVKSVDITGSTIKVSEYLVSFGFEQLSPLASFIALLLSGSELIIGLSLLLNILKRIIYLLTFIMTIGFTILTFYILIASPVSDCGCFGDAIKLTNEETFVKNIILTLFALSLYMYGKELSPKKRGISEYVFFLIVVIYSFSIGIYSIMRLTPIDFLPYQIGTNIPQAMSTPDNAAQNEYKTILTYKNRNNGKIVNFSEADSLYKDSTTWEYISTDYKLIKKGFTPKITGFQILDKNKKRVEDKILNSENQLFIIIRDPRKLDKNSLNIITNILESADRKIVNISILTPSDIAVVNKYLDKDIPVYNMGEKEIQSILRHPSGLLFMNKGTILAKWDLVEYHDFTSIESLKEKIDQQTHRKIIYIIVMLSALILISAALLITKKIEDK